MRKFLVVAGALCALTLIPAVSSAQAVQSIVTKQLKFFTHKAATVNHASLDSTVMSLGAANTADTSYAFGPVVPILGVPDSLLRISVGFKFASAIASGESVYTVVQGSSDGVSNWTNCNVGAIAVGGSLTGQVSNGSVSNAMTQSSATNVAAKSPVSNFFYANWAGFPYIRIIVISDKSAAMAANNTYSATVSFPGIVNRAPN